MVAVPIPHSFPRAEYYRMGEVGLFTDERVELLDGEIITIPSQIPLHVGTVSILATEVLLSLRADFTVRTRVPIVFNNWSEPNPDVAICRFDPDDYQHELPQPSDVLLVIEVAEASLAYDYGCKVAAYASNGIPEYWIVNLVDRRVEVFTDPDPTTQRYGQERYAIIEKSLAELCEMCQTLWGIRELREVGCSCSVM